MQSGLRGAVGAGVAGIQLGGGVDVVGLPSSAHRDVQVLTVQAAAGEHDPDVGGGPLRTVDRGGPPVLGVPGQIVGRERGGPAPAQVLHNQPWALAWFGGLTDLPAVPGFVVMELVQNARNKREVRQALRLVAPLTVVWPTEVDCTRALSDFTAYHLSHGLGLLDALIAATAIGQSATLYTFNVKHYRVVPGLAVAQPYTR